MINILCDLSSTENIQKPNLFDLVFNNYYKYDLYNKLVDCYSIYFFRKQGTIKMRLFLNLLSTNPTKWSNTLKQFVGKLPTNCFIVFDHFVGLAPKGLTRLMPLFSFYTFWLSFNFCFFIIFLLWVKIEIMSLVIAVFYFIHVGYLVLFLYLR